jgi:hypothetical protein
MMVLGRHSDEASVLLNTQGALLEVIHNQLLKVVDVGDTQLVSHYIFQQTGEKHNKITIITHVTIINVSFQNAPEEVWH